MGWVENPQVPSLNHLGPTQFSSLCPRQRIPPLLILVWSTISVGTCTDPPNTLTHRVLPHSQFPATRDQPPHLLHWPPRWNHPQPHSPSLRASLYMMSPERLLPHGKSQPRLGLFRLLLLGTTRDSSTSSINIRAVYREAPTRAVAPAPPTTASRTGPRAWTSTRRARPSRRSRRTPSSRISWISPRLSRPHLQPQPSQTGPSDQPSRIVRHQCTGFSAVEVDVDVMISFRLLLSILSLPIYWINSYRGIWTPSPSAWVEGCCEYLVVYRHTLQFSYDYICYFSDACPWRHSSCIYIYLYDGT